MPAKPTRARQLHGAGGPRKETFAFTADQIGSEVLERFSTDIYNPKAIIRELISNAHDSYAQLEEHLSEIGEEVAVSREVRLDVADNSVIIADDGLGMDRADIDKLVSIALTDKRDMPGVRGYRGIGFWSAYTGGEQVVVESTKLGNDRLFRLTLNTERMRQRQMPNTSIGSIMNDPECVWLESDPAQPEAHGTKIIIVAEKPEGRLNPLLADPEKMRSVLYEGCACQLPEADAGGELAALYSSVEAFTKDVGVKLPRLKFQGTELVKTYPGKLTNYQTEVIDMDAGGGHRIVLARVWYATNQANARLDGPTAGIRVMRDGFPIGKPNLDSDRKLLHSKVEITREDLLDWHVGEVHIVHPDLRPDASGEGIPESSLYLGFRERLRGIYEKLIERSYTKQRTKSLRNDYQKDASFLATVIPKLAAGHSLTPEDTQKAKVIVAKIENDNKLARGQLPQGTAPSDKKAYVRDEEATKLRRQVAATLKKITPALGGQAPQSANRSKSTSKPKPRSTSGGTTTDTASSPLSSAVLLSVIDEIRDAVTEVLKDDETLQNELLTRINEIVSGAQQR